MTDKQLNNDAPGLIAIQHTLFSISATGRPSMVGSVAGGFDPSAPLPEYFSDPSDGRMCEIDNINYVLNLTDEEVIERTTRSMPPLTRRQFMITCANKGIDELIKNSFDLIENETERKIAKIEFDTCLDFERLNPTIVNLTKMLGLSEQEVNDFWDEALSIPSSYSTKPL